MTEPDFIPQEPGVAPDTDTAKLNALAEGNVGDLVEALDALTDDEISQLHLLEMAGKHRTTALGAIQRELQQRAANANAPETDPEPAHAPSPVGDANSYAHMHAREIDATKLKSPVLTLDGWLLPNPSASPEA